MKIENGDDITYVFCVGNAVEASLNGKSGAGGVTAEIVQKAAGKFVGLKSTW